MVRTGVLVHVRHPLTMNWEELVWGLPEEDRLGDLPKLVEILLREAADEPVVKIVMGTTHATKDGFLEGEYTKKYLLDHFEELQKFPRLKPRMELLGQKGLAVLRNRLEKIVITRIIKNTTEEVTESARLFKEDNVDEVIQITAASHGPRCIQTQSVARAEGHIPKHQLWFVVVTDMCFKDSTPLSTLILEEPHRGDDPMTGVKPSVPEVLRQYLSLSPEDKKLFIAQSKKFMDEHKQANN